MSTTTLSDSAQVDTVAAPATPAIQRSGLLAIVLGHLTVDLQTGSLAVLLPLLLKTFSLDYTGAAAIMSFNNIIIALAQPLFGILGDQKQMRWLVYVGCLLTGLGMVAVMFLPSYWLIVAAVIVSGLGSAMFHPEALSVVRAVSGTKAASSSSFFFFGGNLGFAIGPLLAAWLTHSWGAHAAIWMIIPTLIALGFLWANAGAIGQPTMRLAVAHKRSDAPARGKTIWLILLMLGLITVQTIVLSGLKTFIPLYYEQFGQLSADWIALMLTTIALTGAAGTLFGGIAAERIGRKQVILWATVIVIGALLAAMQSAGWTQLLLLGITGFFISMPWPLLVVMVQEAMPNNVGLASGLTLGLAYGASGLGIAALGRVGDLFGLQMTMDIVVWMPIAALVLSCLLPGRKQSVTSTAV
ncbi:MAG: MFS transporter [Caldilineaceae bacterium]|nr:MFS transporter [Caldilineaceae bacterium]